MEAEERSVAPALDKALLAVRGGRCRRKRRERCLAGRGPHVADHLADAQQHIKNPGLRRPRHGGDQKCERMGFPDQRHRGQVIPDPGAQRAKDGSRPRDQPPGLVAEKFFLRGQEQVGHDQAERVGRYGRHHRAPYPDKNGDEGDRDQRPPRVGGFQLREPTLRCQRLEGEQRDHEDPAQNDRQHEHPLAPAGQMQPPPELPRRGERRRGQAGERDDRGKREKPLAVGAAECPVVGLPDRFGEAQPGQASHPAIQQRHRDQQGAGQSKQAEALRPPLGHHQGGQQNQKRRFRDEVQALPELVFEQLVKISPLVLAHWVGAIS